MRFIDEKFKTQPEKYIYQSLMAQDNLIMIIYKQSKLSTYCIASITVRFIAYSTMP